MKIMDTQLSEFTEIKQMIEESRRKAAAAVDSVTVDLYWNMGKFISERLCSSKWGESVVNSLSAWLAKEEPGLSGFSPSNLHRMVKFYEIYSDPVFLECVRKFAASEKVAPPVRLLPENKEKKPLPEKVAPVVQLLEYDDVQQFTINLLRHVCWSNHLLIISGKKTPEEKLFYLVSAQKEHWGKRELQRQIQSSLYERTLSGELKLPEKIKNLQSHSSMVFRDSYSLELLGIPMVHDEKDIRKSIVTHLKEFFLEFGKDFCFMGEEYKIQVGMKDFSIDLLFYHRELRCLVAVELKSREFQPKDLGQLEFYLESMDRQIKKEWENPSIGILLCKEKDDAVVEYSLSRAVSPAMIAEYTRLLPKKEIVQARLQELMDQSL